MHPMESTKSKEGSPPIAQRGAQIQVSEELVHLTKQYQQRGGWLVADIISGAAECGLRLVLGPEGPLPPDIGGMFVWSTDRAARQRFRRVHDSPLPAPASCADGGLRDDLTEECVFAQELQARLRGCEGGNLLTLATLGLKLEQDTIEKDGVTLRPYEDSTTWGGKCTRCGCLYQLPEGWSLGDLPPRAEDIRWLAWPREERIDAREAEAGGKMIEHPERNPQHVAFRVELPDGRFFQGGVRGVLRSLSAFNRENSWPDEVDHASIWKPAPDGGGLVLDFGAMDEREQRSVRPEQS